MLPQASFIVTCGSCVSWWKFCELCRCWNRRPAPGLLLNARLPHHVCQKSPITKLTEQPIQPEHRVSSCPLTPYPKLALSHLVGQDQFFKCPRIRKNSVVSTISKSRLAVYEHKCLADLHNRGSASAPRVHFQPTNNHCNQPTNCKCTKSPTPTNWNAGRAKLQRGDQKEIWAGHAIWDSMDQLSNGQIAVICLVRIMEAWWYVQTVSWSYEALW